MIDKPSFSALFEMIPPRNWGINRHEEMNYVRIYSGDDMLYEYQFQDAQEAERQSRALWRKWKAQP